jgi:LPS sulfotransferase NodH
MYHHDKDTRTAWKWLRDHLPDLKIIHLVRENTLRVHVSLLIGQETKEWRVAMHNDRRSQKPESVQVDLSEWEQRSEYLEKLRDEALSFFSNHEMLRVTYAELTGSWDETTQRIQTFLGVTPHPLAKKTRKQNPQPLSELIANYDEVAAALRGTEREWMLEEESSSK